MSSPVVFVMQLLAGCDDGDEDRHGPGEKSLAEKGVTGEPESNQSDATGEARQETYEQCIERINGLEQDWRAANNITGAWVGSLSDARGFGAVGAIVEEWLNGETADAMEVGRNQQCEPVLRELSSPLELDIPDWMQRDDPTTSETGDSPDPADGGLQRVIQLPTIRIEGESPCVVELPTLCIDAYVDGESPTEPPEVTAQSPGCEPTYDALLPEPSFQLELPELLKGDDRGAGQIDESPDAGEPTYDGVRAGEACEDVPTSDGANVIELPTLCIDAYVESESPTESSAATAQRPTCEATYDALLPEPSFELETPELLQGDDHGAGHMDESSDVAEQNSDNDGGGAGAY